MVPRGSSGQLTGITANQVPGGTGAERWPTYGGLARGHSHVARPCFPGPQLSLPILLIKSPWQIWIRMVKYVWLFLFFEKTNFKKGFYLHNVFLRDPLLGPLASKCSDGIILHPVDLLWPAILQLFINFLIFHFSYWCSYYSSNL